MNKEALLHYNLIMKYLLAFFFATISPAFADLTKGVYHIKFLLKKPNIHAHWMSGKFQKHPISGLCFTSSTSDLLNPLSPKNPQQWLFPVKVSPTRIKMPLIGYHQLDDGSVPSLHFKMEGELSKRDDQFAGGDFQASIDGGDGNPKTLEGKFIIYSEKHTKALEEKSKAEPLAPIADLPAGLNMLKLNKSQAKQIDSWLKSKDGNPDHLPSFLSTILRTDQRMILAKKKLKPSDDPNKK